MGPKCREREPAKICMQSMWNGPEQGHCKRVPPEWSSDFPYFLQFKSEFGSKEFMAQA